jgi:hypothetical protein
MVIWRCIGPETNVRFPLFFSVTLWLATITKTTAAAAGQVHGDPDDILKGWAAFAT